MALKKVGVIGSGVVSQVLADGLLKYGYEVMRGTRESAILYTTPVAPGPLLRTVCQNCLLALEPGAC